MEASRVAMARGCPTDTPKTALSQSQGTNSKMDDLHCVTSDLKKCGPRKFYVVLEKHNPLFQDRETFNKVGRLAASALVT